MINLWQTSLIAVNLGILTTAKATKFNDSIAKKYFHHLATVRKIVLLFTLLFLNMNFKTSYLCRYIIFDVGVSSYFYTNAKCRGKIFEFVFVEFFM